MVREGVKEKEFLFSLNTVELLEFFGNNIFVYYLWKHNTTKSCFELWLSLVCDPSDELNTYAVIIIVILVFRASLRIICYNPRVLQIKDCKIPAPGHRADCLTTVLTSGARWRGFHRSLGVEDNSNQIQGLWNFQGKIERCID